MLFELLISLSITIFASAQTAKFPNTTQAVVPKEFLDKYRALIGSEPVPYAPWESAWEGRCTNLTLVGHDEPGNLTLWANCKDKGETVWETQLNLNDCINNNLGVMEWEPTLYKDPRDPTNKELWLLCTCYDIHTKPRASRLRIGPGVAVEAEKGIQGIDGETNRNLTLTDDPFFWPFEAVPKQPIREDTSSLNSKQPPDIPAQAIEMLFQRIITFSLAFFPFSSALAVPTADQMLDEMYQGILNNTATPYDPSRWTWNWLCRNVRVEGGEAPQTVMLKADCRDEHGNLWETALNLNDCLSTHMGSMLFSIRPNSFDATCYGCKLYNKIHERVEQADLYFVCACNDQNSVPKVGVLERAAGGDVRVPAIKGWVGLIRRSMGFL
ncbi:Fc.00g088200.m01.CDS01 [Cosmosporella sp. VM-42]